MSEYIEFIPKAGACLATTNVMERRGKVRWMVRAPSTGGADNGWQIMSDIDTSDYLNTVSNWQIVDYNGVCYIEPALVGIWDFEVGSDLQIVRDERGITIYDSPTGLRIPDENFYVPPQFRA
ncbi:hypothetical protein BKG77_22440 [Mycobacteroides chelonae]|nr:hypothetical protein BKG77_22440 [Mycobacteroides chelonae]